MVITASSTFPGGAFGLLRKRTCPTTEFDGVGVVVLFGRKKAKRRPEATMVATSKAIETMCRGLCCLAGGCGAVGSRTAGGDTWERWAMTLAGVFVAEFGNRRLPGLLSAGAVKGVCPSFADGVNAESDEMIGGGEDWNEKGVKDAGVIPSGWEGCSGL